MILPGIFVFALSLLAGWVINWAADTLPKQRLARRGEAETQPRAAASFGARRLIVLALAGLLGWLAYECTDSWSAALLLAGQAWFFLAVAVIDLEHRLVLNRMLLAALPVLLLAPQLVGERSFGAALLSGLIGFTLFFVMALIRPGSMGMGDVKLAGLIGLAVGLPDLYLALLVGVLAGGLMGLFILIRSGFQRGQSVAYAALSGLGRVERTLSSGRPVAYAGTHRTMNILFLSALFVSFAIFSLFARLPPLAACA